MIRLLSVIRETSAVVGWIWRHPANEGRQWRSLAQACRFQLRGRLLRKPTITAIGAKSVLEVQLHASGASKAVYANPPDWPEMIVWSRRLKAGDLFIDVGANAGVYALFAADLGARVIALEPSPRAAHWLRRNVALNGLPIEVVQAALTDHEGTVDFDWSGDATGHIGGPEVVPATTLDAVLAGERAAGVKIDVEGFERLVLIGGMSALREGRIACLQLEWNACSRSSLGEDRLPTAALLAQVGYGLYRPKGDGSLIPVTDLSFGADIFALPVDHLQGKSQDQT